MGPSRHIVSAICAQRSRFTFVGVHVGGGLVPEPVWKYRAENVVEFPLNHLFGGLLDDFVRFRVHCQGSLFAFAAPI